MALNDKPMIMVATDELVMFMPLNEEAYIAGDSVCLGDML